MLWQALGHEPPTWAHVPVLVNEQRKKLSKRRDKVALEQYRAEGYLADAMVNYLMTLGWAPAGDTEIVPWARIEAEFRLEDVNHAPAFFDLKKLAAFNGEYIRMLPLDEFVAACDRWLPAGMGPSGVRPDGRARADPRRHAWRTSRRWSTSCSCPSPRSTKVRGTRRWRRSSRHRCCGEVVDAYTTVEFVAPELKSALEAIAERHEQKLGKAQAPVRVAVTGRTVGPPLFESLEVMGRDETLRRLRAGAGAPATHHDRRRDVPTTDVPTAEVPVTYAPDVGPLEREPMRFGSAPAAHSTRNRGPRRRRPRGHRAYVLRGHAVPGVVDGA